MLVTNQGSPWKSRINDPPSLNVMAPVKFDEPSLMVIVVAALTTKNMRNMRMV